jgi:hypothetical protein
MDTLTEKFASYLEGKNNHGKSLFYHRAGISANHFWKLKAGWKFPKPETIVSLALATEGECRPSDVFEYFETVRLAAIDESLLKMLREGWVGEAKFARAEAQYDLDARIRNLEARGHSILTKGDESSEVEYTLGE